MRGTIKLDTKVNTLYAMNRNNAIYVQRWTRSRLKNVQAGNGPITVSRREVTYLLVR